MTSPGAPRYLLGIGIAVLLLPIMLIALIASDDTPNNPLGGISAGQLLKPDAPIPAKYVPWVNKAGHICADVGPALVAAHIDTETRWREDAVAVNPPEAGGNAVGLAQFQDRTWKTWGADANGDGTSSPRDGADAIMALATFMCSNVLWAKTQLAQHTVTGDVIKIALAAYFCGRDCVLAAHGVPATGKAHDYPNKVLELLAKYGQPFATGTWTLPLATGTYKVGSGFGPRGGRLHAGVDLMAAKATPIYAAAGGTAVTVLCQSGNGSCDIDGGAGVGGCGWYVDIEHPAGIVTRYCHMLRKPNVTVGQPVQTGQPIGIVGSSGNSSGPHLHFEVHDVRRDKHATNTNATNPITFLRSVGLNP